MLAPALDPDWTSSLYKNLIQHSDDPYWLIDPETSVFLEANDASLKQLGYTTQELLGRLGVKDVNQSLNSIPAWKEASGGLKVGETFRYVADLQHKSGHLVTCEITLKRVNFENREVFVAVTRDVSELVAVEKALRDREGLMNSILHSMRDGVMVLDPELNCKYANSVVRTHPAMQLSCKGNAFQWCQGMWFDETGVPLSDIDFPLLFVRSSNVPRCEQLLEFRSELGVSCWLKTSAFSVELASQKLLVLMLSDVTDLQQSRQQVRYVSSFDPTTGLPNRHYFTSEAQSRLTECQSEGRYAALLQIDIDNFQARNDAFGHARCDEILRRLGSQLRQRLPEKHLLARMGGDEFGLLIAPLGFTQEQANEEILQVTQIVRDVINLPMHLDGLLVKLTACRGCVLQSPDEMADVQELLVRSSVALNVAKASGRNSFRMFEPKMLAEKINVYNIEDAIRQGLEREEFELYIQPQWRLSDGAIIGGEGLARWNHPQRGVLTPAHFIDVAEDSGLIVPMGELLLRNACKIARELNECRHLHQIAHFSVNISAIQFAQPGFYAVLKDIVRQESCRPEWLQLEVTESVLIKGRDSMSALTAKLRNDGFVISLDDFGTGFSSLSYLKQLTLDELKIDRSFVANIASDVGDKTIVEAVLAMAKTFNFKVVAEGIETREQAKLLNGLGCGYGQGYLLAKAMPLPEFLRWLNTPESRVLQMSA